MALDAGYADAVFNLASLAFEAGDARRGAALVGALPRARSRFGLGADGRARPAFRRAQGAQLDPPAEMGPISCSTARRHAATSVLLAHGAGAPMDSAGDDRGGAGAGGGGARRRALRVRLYGGAAQRPAPAAAAGRERDAGVSRRGRRRSRRRAGSSSAASRWAGGSPAWSPTSCTPRAGSRASSASAIRSIRRGGRSSCAPAHLEGLRTPALICQGTRDPFGTREEVAGYALSPRIEILWLEDGDHDLRPRKAA